MTHPFELEIKLELERSTYNYSVGLIANITL